MKQITIMEHPLIQHKISILRNEATGTNEFRRLIEEIAMLMGYEALVICRLKMWKLRHQLRRAGHR